MANKKPPPPGWADDKLSNFFQLSYENLWATFANLEEFATLKEINKLFFLFNENLKFNADVCKDSDPFAAMFTAQAHCCYMAAAFLSTSGQLQPAYMVLRGSLEQSLYGFYFDRHFEMAKTWLERMDSEAAKRKVRKEFRPSAMIAELITVDKRVGRLTERLYEQTIDFGGHPNIAGLISTLQMHGTERQKLLKLLYHTGHTPEFRRCLRVNAQVGLCSLAIFRLIFPERFAILGVDSGISRLERSVFPDGG